MPTKYEVEMLDGKLRVFKSRRYKAKDGMVKLLSKSFVVDPKAARRHEKWFGFRTWYVYKYIENNTNPIPLGENEPPKHTSTVIVEALRAKRVRDVIKTPFDSQTLILLLALGVILVMGLALYSLSGKVMP